MMTTVRRLTETFSPSHYELLLDIDRVGRTFLGTVIVQGTLHQSGPIRFHAKDLTIIGATVDGTSANVIDADNDEIVVEGNFSTKGHAVTFEFTGVISDQMHGMYPCYFEDTGTKKELVATQFESHHAREVFPCIDEPAAKATFDVTLKTETGVQVLANMPVKSQSEADSKLVTSFERTPVMSSYLLAWVYGDLHRKTATSKSGVEVNVWATPAQTPDSLDFALDIATRTIDFFDEYFGIPYPLPKCDHVALPDFSSGAMENWGLITYREVALLAEPGAVSVASKHRIAAVIAHELSHQWFGNLVTMEWWNNLWLNESFANLMEYIAIDALEPSWNVWFDFAAYETVLSLRRDATDGVQAVQVEVHHPDDISTLFDPAIVYAKGSRLLRMLERFIGSTAFRDGLRAYFKQHAYGNTTEADLWSALSNTSGQDINDLMTKWISQPGYPVISVGANGLTQERFFIGKHEPSDATWQIPLGSNDPGMPKLMTSRELAWSVDSTLRLNVDDSAHFITHYDEQTLQLIVESIKDGSTDPVGRLQLLHEQILLSRGRVTASAKLVPLLDAYRNESIESVWDILAAGIGELKKFVETDGEADAALRSIAKDLAHAQFQRLGWIADDTEPESDTKLRATILGLTLYGEDGDALAHADRLARGDIRSIDAELRDIVLSSAIKHASDNELFDRLLVEYKHTSSAELQQDIAGGLTSAIKEHQIKRLLVLLTDSTFVRTQDVARWFVYLIRNRYARTLTWEWLRENWAWIEKTFSGDKSYDDYPRYSATGLMTRQQLDEYKAFFGPLRSQRSLTRVIDMGITDIEAKVGLIESESNGVKAALLNHK